MERNQGVLALTGSAEYTPRMEPVDRYLIERIGEPARVGCIAAASAPDGTATYDRWGQMGLEHFGERLGAQAEVIPLSSHEDAMDESIADQIRSCNFIYLSGGKPNYLASTLMNSPAYDALVAVMDAGGVVAGCSAGAMVWGAIAMPGAQGFEVLPERAVVMPHYDEFGGFMHRMMKGVGANGKPMLGIDGATALIWDASGFHVKGMGGVTVWNSDGKRRFTDGQALNWP